MSRNWTRLVSFYSCREQHSNRYFEWKGWNHKSTSTNNCSGFEPTTTFHRRPKDVPAKVNSAHSVDPLTPSTNDMSLMACCADLSCVALTFADLSFVELGRLYYFPWRLKSIHLFLFALKDRRRRRRRRRRQCQQR